MKKYESPVIEITVTKQEDIIMASTLAANSQSLQNNSFEILSVDY